MKITLNLIFALILSTLALFFNQYIISATNLIFLYYSKVDQHIGFFFQDGPISHGIVFLLSVATLTCGTYFPPLLIYRLIKKKPFTYRHYYFWGLWLTIILALCLPLHLLGQLS